MTEFGMYDDIDLKYYEKKAFKKGLFLGAAGMFFVCLVLGLTVT